MDGLFSFITKPLKKAVGWAASGGNLPGTPESRKLGYEPSEVEAAVANNIATGQHLTEPGVIAPTNLNTTLLYSGLALGAVFLLTRGGKTRGH